MYGGSISSTKTVEMDLHYNDDQGRCFRDLSKSSNRRRLTSVDEHLALKSREKF